VSNAGCPQCERCIADQQVAAHQWHRKWISAKMKEWFKLSPRCQRLRAINPSMPSLRFRRDIQGLEHWKASLLVPAKDGACHAAGTFKQDQQDGLTSVPNVA